MAIPTEGDVKLRHVAVDGPIGVGKTSLVEMLARRFHGTKILEDVDNPFLPDFYKKKKGAAFQTQLFFLLARYQQQQEIAQIDLFSNLVVADYHFPKDKIFACLNLDDSELLIYDKLYTLLSESVRKPDLVIYLQGSIETCMKRVKKKARAAREGDHAGVPGAADRGLQLLLLPLRGDAAARRRHQRDRLRQPPGGLRRPGRRRSRRPGAASSTTSRPAAPRASLSSHPMVLTSRTAPQLAE